MFSNDSFERDWAHKITSYIWLKIKARHLVKIY